MIIAIYLKDKQNKVKYFYSILSVCVKCLS